MSGQRKKWSKQQKKDKRDFAQVLLPEVADELKKYLPTVKSITAARLAERYKISLTIARNVLEAYAENGTLVKYIDHSKLRVYGKKQE